MNELAQLIDEFLDNNGIKRTFVCEKLGMSSQLFYKLMHKKNFSVNDANRILNTVNKKISFKIIDN